MPRKSTKEQFIKKANIKHGVGRYNYDQVIYISTKDKVIILCNMCKMQFETTPGGHLNGNGCWNCSYVQRSNNRRMTRDHFIKKGVQVHGVDKYNYIDVIYIDSTIKVIIWCNNCGFCFEQSPNNHLSGHGCPFCGLIQAANSHKLSKEQFIEKSNNIHIIGRYDYKDVIYINCATKVWILCNKCKNNFDQTPNSHICGQGCPFCINKTELKLMTYLKSVYVDVQRQITFADLRDIGLLKYDFKVNQSILIELQGRQHYEPVARFGGEYQFQDQQKKDAMKVDYCKKNNRPLICIYQPDVKLDKNDWQNKLQQAIERAFDPEYLIQNIGTIYEQ